jgi:type VI secretion system protein ImpL
MIDMVLNTLRTMTDYVRLAFSSLPWVIIILLIIAAIIMLLTLLLAMMSVRKAGTKAHLPPSAKAQKEGDGEEDENNQTKLPPLGGWISEFLSKKGVFHVSSLSLSFLRALDFLRNSLQTYNYKYRLPWYLLIGAENSGKTSLIEGSELQLPMGQPDFGIKHPNPDCRWWFMNRGIILDIRGRLFIKSKNVGDDEKGWRSLLILLTRYRSARPINGIILTIPANELYGKHKLNKDEISSRADFLSNKLVSAQTSLGLRVPVYVVVTKLDTIPGFQSFCSEIPTSNRHNMLGWSSPYTLGTAYTVKWVEEAFSELEESLNQLRLEIFAEGRITTARDGVFVFPSELSTLKDGLAIYLNHIFKNDAYLESLLLRGIYFCGDSGVTPLRVLGNGEEEEDDPENFAVVGTPDAALNQANDGISLASQLTRENEPIKRKIFFFDELINSKVLKEPGLATPLQRRLISINRALNLAKIMTAIFILFGSYGLFNAYEKFTLNRDYILPVLSKMNMLLRDMQQIKLSQPHQSTEIFDTYARQLIEMMDQLQQTNFFSVFVPASWFSPLHEDLHKTLKMSYQQVIIRTVYIDLLLKARELLHLRPTSHDQSTSIAQLLQPTASAEYNLLKHFVEGMAELQTKIEKFNNLKHAADPSDLNDLVSYTFNAHLPQQFINQYKKFRKLLLNTAFPPIDLKPYQQLARETLNILYQNFLNVTFTITDPNSLPSRLHAFLQQMSQQDTKQLPNVVYLRQLSVELAQVMPTLGEPGQTWIDKEFFNPGKEFDNMLDKIDSSRLFGKEVTQFLVDQTAIGFNNLKIQLHSLNQLLVDHQPSMPTAPLAQKVYSVPPSQGLISLHKGLVTLFSEPYMAAPTEHAYTTLVPSGKIIYWDAKLIQMAYDMCKRFEEFNSKQVSGFPPLLQGNMKLLARDSLQANIINMIAKAQNFVDAPTNLSEGLAAEEILRSKIGDIKEVAPKFIKLLEVLNQDAVGASFVELRGLLSSTTYWLLTQVENVLKSQNPYMIHDLTFSWWDGKVGAAFTGFSSKDTEDLKTYLHLQNQQMQSMTLDFAKPLVTFLSADVMLDNSSGDVTLLNKWRRIIEQVEAYNKKQPGNSIAVLEDFILRSLNAFDTKNCFGLIPLADIRQETGDYFLEIVRCLKKGVLSRGEVLKRQQGIQQYKELATLFNTNLKNKFPFIGTNLSLGTTEADPEKMREFFKKYDEFGGSAKVVFDQIYQLGSEMTEATQFLQRLDILKAFFQNYLSGEGDNDLPTFDLSVDFRINREKESGGDLIVDWILKPDPDTIINKNDKARNGRWLYGNPVEISFRWPDVAPVSPVSDHKQPLLEVDGKKATYRYTGRWALFWMLRMHAANKGEFLSLKDPNPYVLKFVIPTGLEETAIVYNLLTLMMPSSNPKAPGKVLKVPDFPSFAPEISSEVSKYADKPVITEGIVAPVELTNLPGTPDQGTTASPPTPTPSPHPATAAPPPHPAAEKQSPAAAAHAS